MLAGTIAAWSCPPRAAVRRTGRSPLPGLVAVTLAVLLQTGSAPRAAEPEAAAVAVPLRADTPDSYQNFVVNWDPTVPVLCALIRTPADYASVFHPAPVIGGRRPFAPPDDRFDKESLVVIARVIDAPGTPAKGAEALAIERVTRRDGGLEIHARFRPPADDASFSVKQAAIAWIPAGEWTSVTFLENGVEVATLDPADGAWIAPPLPPAE